MLYFIEIILFSVGVDQAEDVVLNLIASYPQRNHVYKISQYDQLSQLSDAIAEHICHESRGIYIHRGTNDKTSYFNVKILI